MAGAGMTRGGFYSYFQSKSELYAETISCFVTEKQEDIASSEKASDRAVTLLRDYLSHQQLDQLEASCPLIGLPQRCLANRSIGAGSPGVPRYG